jgi:hypothetical protein
MNKRLANLAILLLLCFSMSVNAQDSTYLRANIKDSILYKEPTWKFENDTIIPFGEIGDYESLILIWTSGDSHVSAIILIHPSVQSASYMFNNFRIDGLRMKLSEERVPNLGDNNRMWDGEGTKEVGVYFRRGNVIVNVAALSKKTAKDFAHHIADCIPDA